jgi:glycosyltransferase involved in cell wall biosynthesis
MNKKILIFDISFLTGNNRTPIISKIKYWQKRGLQIDIFCTGEAKDHYTEKVKNVNYLVLPWAKSSSNRLFLIFENLKRNLIALIFLAKISFSKYLAIYSISAVLDLVIFPYLVKKFNRKIKWVVVFDNTVEKNEPGNKIIKSLAYIFYRYSLFFIKNADFLFVVTSLLKKRLLAEGFNSKILITTGNGVETNLIKKVTINKKVYDGLFVGRINDSKGVFDLLNVLEIVCKKIPNFKLAIVGRGDEDSELRFKFRVKELKLQKNIKLLGFKSGAEKIKIFKQSKIFVFLSPSESFGVALLEAVCCGLPAVVYDLEPYKYIYKNQEITKLKIGDFEGVAKEVLNILENKNFNNKGGKKLLNRYSWDIISKIELKAITK